MIIRELNPVTQGVPPAVMKHRPGFAPMRELVTGRRAQPTSLFFSRKNEREVSSESSGERFGIWCAETDVSVSGYFEQPFTLSWVQNGRRVSYTPDRLDIRATGNAVVEMKYDTQKVLRDEYREKLEVARRILVDAGYTFEIDTAERIRNSVEFSAVEEVIYCAHGWQVSPYEQVSLAKILHEQHSLTLAEASDILGGGRQGRARLLWLVPIRIVHVDLSAKLSEESLVTLGPQGVRYVT